MSTVEVSVNVDMLKTGMEVKNRIIFERNGKMFFICKDIVLSDEMITKIKTIIAPVDSIYISFDDYKALFIDVKESEYAAPYKYVKFETANMIEDISSGSHTSGFAADAITHTVQEQVESVDISLIIESVNASRTLDEYMLTHSTNVALLNGIMGKKLGYDNDAHYALVKIGLLHDVGMLKVPQYIVNKEGMLTQKEYDEVKRHPKTGYDMLVDLNEKDERILNGVLQHHERVNGTGYPYGLAAEDISEFARITAITDAYDAMISGRPYREAHSPFKILDNFSRGAYSEFDINYVKVFVACMVDELKGKYVLMSDETIARVSLVLSDNLKFPVVQIGNKVIQTTPEFYCVSMYNGDEN